MEDYKKDVPYIVYESEAARHERTVKRLLMALLITILLMVGTNMAWLYVFNQYDFASESYVIEGADDSNANMLGNGASMNGVINNERKDTGETENGN
jgi:hypothetical protein